MWIVLSLNNDLILATVTCFLNWMYVCQCKCPVVGAVSSPEMIYPTHECSSSCVRTYSTGDPPKLWVVQAFLNLCALGGMAGRLKSAIFSGCVRLSVTLADVTTAITRKKMAFRTTRRKRYASRPRRRFVKRVRTTRTRRPRTALRRLSRRVSAIRRNLAPEFKAVDYNLNTPPGEAANPQHVWLAQATWDRSTYPNPMGIPGEFNTANPPVPGYISTFIQHPREGTDQDERIGAQVLYRSIQITGIASCYGGDVGAGGFQSAMTGMSGYLRIMVLLDTQAHTNVNTTDPVPRMFTPDIDGAYSTASRRSPYTHLRYKVIASRTYSLSMGQRPSAMINIQVPMRRVMHFGVDVNDEAAVNNRFYVIGLVSPTLDMTGAPTTVQPQFVVRLQARIRYIDS